MKVYKLFAVVALFADGAVWLCGTGRHAGTRPTQAPAAVEPTKAPEADRGAANRPRPLRPPLRPPPPKAPPASSARPCAPAARSARCGPPAAAASMRRSSRAWPQVKWTADGVQPLLAESWDMEEGGKAFVFHLREGVKWHDGAPFTADDVVFTFNIFANPAVGSTYAAKLSNVLGYDEFKAGTATSLAGVTKVDDKTVRVELKSACAAVGRAAADLHQHPAQSHPGQRRARPTAHERLLEEHGRHRPVRHDQVRR